MNNRSPIALLSVVVISISAQQVSQGANLNRRQWMSWLEEREELETDKELIQRKGQRAFAATQHLSSTTISYWDVSMLTEDDWKWLASRHPKNAEVLRMQARALFADNSSGAARKGGNDSGGGSNMEGAAPAILEKALRLYRKAVSVNDANTDAWKQLAEAAKALKYYDEAVKANRALVRIEPDSATAWRGLGEALEDSGDIDGAALEYRRGLELSNDANKALADFSWTDLCKSLASLLVRSGKADEALQVIERVVRLSFDSRYAMTAGRESSKEPVNVGVELAVNGKTAEAMEALKTAPGFPAP